MSLLLLLSASAPAALTLTCEGASVLLDGKNVNLIKSFTSVSGGSAYRIKTEIDGAALFTDTITQANGTILGDTAEWDRWNTTTVDTINSNGTNAVSTTANRTSVGVIVANTSFGPDQWAEHTHASNSGGRFTSGPLVRASSGTTTNGYSFLNAEGNGFTNPSAFRIVKHVSNGTPTTLATSGPEGFGPIANSTTYTMRLEVIGDRLFGYIDGKLIVTAIDSTFTTGQPGFQIIYGGSTISFSAGQIAASNSVVLAQRTLTCTAQSYAVTSNDANLKVDRNLAAATQSYAVTSNDANLIVARVVETRGGFFGITAASFSSVFTDNFNRANSASLGANWQLNQNTFRIVSNQVRASTSFFVESLASVTTGTYNNDQFAEVDLFGGTAAYLGVGVRLSGKSGYYVTTIGGAPQIGVVIFKYDAAGSDTILYSGDIVISGNQRLKLSVEGSVLTVSYANQIIVKVNDTTYSSGVPGIQYRNTGFGTAALDNFNGGNTIALTNVVAQRTLTCTAQSYAVTSNDTNLIVARLLTAKVFADEELFTDDFTGTAGVLGSNYTQQGDANIRLDGLGNAHAVATSRGLAWPDTVVFSNDQYAEITITAIETGGNNSGVGLRIQTGVSPPVEQGYVFRTGNSGAAYTFAQYNAASTNVNIITTSIIPQVGDRIRAVVVGNTQYFYVNNQLIAIGSSTSWPTGVPAIYGNGTVWKSDNFVAGNYGGLHLAGTYTTVKSGRVLSCATASYALTLNDAILTKTAGRTLIADPVSFTLATTDTGIIYARRLALDVKTFTIATSTLNLLVSKKLVATLQTYAIGSTQVTFLRGLRVSVTAQAFTLTGPPNNNLLRGRKVLADIRSYSLAPVPVNLLYGRLVTATLQTYTLSMAPANIICDRSLSATSQTYSLVRNDANILRKAVLGATQQTYNIAGIQVALVKVGARVLIASPTSLTLGTTEVTLARSRILSLTVYAGVLTRNPANVLYGRKVIADIRTYTLSPSVTNLNRGRLLGITVYTSVLARNPANILRNRTVIADIRTYTLSPSVTNLNRGRLLGVTVYAATLTRNPANILQNRVVIADIRAFTYTRLDANILKGRRLTLDKQSYNFTFNQLLFGRGGFIKVWTGSAWTPKPLKTWNGTAWVSKPLKVWTGSVWRTY